MKAKDKITDVEKINRRNLYILIGLLFLMLIIFGASVFDGNRFSTVITGGLAFLFAGAIVYQASQMQN